MEKEVNETDEEILEKLVRVIKTIEDDALRGDSFAAMSIMSSDRYSVELIKKYVRREMLMNSPLYDIWMEEEREDSEKKGVKKGRKYSVIELLELNFDLISKDTREYIENIDDENIIDRLFQKAAKAKSLDEFEEFLDKVKKLD